jgi:hypothetical protein
VTGRGLIAAYTANDLPEDMEHPRELAGETVEIDGKQMVVVNVEYSGQFIPGRYNHVFGLIVKPAPPLDY